jgi:hypothetical protein
MKNGSLVQNTKGRMKPRSAAMIFVAAALLVAALPARGAWDHPHGDSENSGFANVVTAPAVRPMQLVPVGELSAGAGPVVGSDGTVYVGNLFGQVFAFHANGSPAWGHQLPSGQWVTASPVLGADGSIYVVSETRRPADGSPILFIYESMLHKFTPTGDLVFQAPFPEHQGLFNAGRGDANAAPNILRMNEEDIVLALALYYTEWHLIAFSSNDGHVLADTLITKAVPGEVTQGSFCSAACEDSLLTLLCGFCVHVLPLPCTDFSVCLPEGTGGPRPGVAVWQDSPRGAPAVVVSDGRLDTVGYMFDPAGIFSQTFRVHDKERTGSSPPMILTDGHTAVGTRDPFSLGRVTFAQPSPLQLTDLQLADEINFTPVDATPTRLADGRLVVIEHKGRLSVRGLLGNQSQSNNNHLAGESIASAAASCTYFYAASAGALATFDISTLQQVASVPWYGGGLSSPAIGPLGHVYAVATNTMFVFPPGPNDTKGGTACSPGETRGVR